MFLRQQPAARGTMAALEGSGRGTCVMVLGGNGKFSIGFDDPKRDVIVSCRPAIFTTPRATPLRRSWRARRPSAPEASFFPAATRSRRAPY
jgi:hypothetical protein